VLIISASCLHSPFTLFVAHSPPAPGQQATVSQGLGEQLVTLGREVPFFSSLQTEGGTLGRHSESNDPPPESEGAVSGQQTVGFSLAQASLHSSREVPDFPRSMNPGFVEQSIGWPSLNVNSLHCPEFGSQQKENLFPLGQALCSQAVRLWNFVCSALLTSSLFGVSSGSEVSAQGQVQEAPISFCSFAVISTHWVPLSFSWAQTKQHHFEGSSPQATSISLCMLGQEEVEALFSFGQSLLKAVAQDHAVLFLVQQGTFSFLPHCSLISCSVGEAVVGHLLIQAVFATCSHCHAFVPTFLQQGTGLSAWQLLLLHSLGGS